LGDDLPRVGLATRRIAADTPRTDAFGRLVRGNDTGNWRAAWISATLEQKPKQPFSNFFERHHGQCQRRERRCGGGREPLFQAAAANFNPWSKAKVDSTNPQRVRC
jgi:hypothetical protein